MDDEFAYGEKGRQKNFLSRRLGRFARPSGGLKKSINLAKRRLDLQVQRLDNALKRLLKRDRSIFARTVDAFSTKHTLRAKALANELAELRKVEKMLARAKLALESVSLRLGTVSEFGDIVKVLAPAAGVIKNIRSDLGTVYPRAGRGLAEIGDLLTGIVSSTSQSYELPLNTELADGDAQKILEEASLVAERRVAEKIPEIPTEVSDVDNERTRTDYLTHA